MANASLNPICVGIDVGQITDPSALSVAEVSRLDTGKIRIDPGAIPGHHDRAGLWIPAQGFHPVLRSEYAIRYIARLPLGTSYPDVAVYIADVLCSPMFVGRKVRVLIDVTGVGRPVYEDLLKEAKLREQSRAVVIKPISFVHGESYNRRKGTLGKAFLVSRLQSLLQGRRVHAPDTAEVKATLEELRTYEIKVSQDAKDTYGASTGNHDDLATALGLSCLEDPYNEEITYSKRVY